MNEVGVLGESLGKSLDALHSDPVLRKSDDFEEAVGGERFGEKVRRPVLQSVSTTDERSEVGPLTFSLGCFGGIQQGLGDNVSSGGTHAVVVEDKVGEREVGGEEGNDGLGASTSEGVV